MDSISILIKAILEKSSKQQLEQELKNIENKLKPVNVEVTTNSESQIKLYNSLQKIYKEEEKQRLTQEKASDKALADKEKILQYEQKVRKAIEDSNLKEQQKTKELQEQIALFQKRMQLESSRITGKYDSLVDNKALNSLENEISGLSTSTPNVANKMKDFSLSMKEVELNAKNSSNAIKNTKQDSISFGEDLRRSAFKFTEWYLLAGGVTSAIDALKQGISTIINTDTALTNLKKVSDEIGNTVGIKAFLSDINKMAIEVGHSTQAAIDSVTSFKKLGYSLQESQTLAKESLIYSNISDQPIEDATQSIISTLKGFQLGVQNVTHVMDAYNEVGNKFSITSAGIGSALQRSSSTLYEAGNTLEQSIGLITAANASIQNPEKVGNGLKTVAMRLRGIADESGEAYPQLDKLIKKITDVEIMKDKNTFKSTYDIMVEISKVWKSLTDTNRATLQEAMFGKQQGSVGASLLNNMADGVKATETAINSLGSSTKEQARYMESIQAHINTLKETFVNFWNQSINSKTVINFVDVISHLVNSFGNLNNVLLLAGTSFAIWKGASLTSSIKGLKDFSLSTKMASSEMQFFKTIGSAMQLQEMGLLTSTQLLGASFKALGVAIKTSFLSNPIGWLALIGTGIYEIYNAISSGADKAKQKIAEFNEQIKQQQDVLKNIDSLSQQYEKNAFASKTDENAKSQLLDIQNQLKEAFEKTGKSIEFETNNVEKNIKAIQNLKKEQLQDYINSNFASINQIQSEMSKKISISDIFNSTLKGTNLSFSDVADNIKTTLGKTLAGIGVEEFKDTKENYVKLLQEIINKQKDLNTINSPEYLGDKYVSQLSEKYQELKKEVEDNNSTIKTFNEYQKSLVQSGLSGLDELDEKQKKLFEDLSNPVEFDSKNTDTYKKSLQDLVDLIGEYGNQPNELKTKLESWASTNKVVSDSISGLNSDIINSDNALKNAKKTAEEYKKEFEELTNAYSSQTKKVQELVAYREELNSKEGLSSKSMEEIIEKHQELAPYLNDEAKLRTKLTEIIKQEEQTQITAYVKMMEASQTFFNSQIIGNTQLVNELNKKYGIDLENYKSLAEAKDAIEQKLIQGLSNMWGAFYDAQNQTFTDNFYKLQSAMPSAASAIQKNMQPDLDKFKEVENRFKGIVLKLAPVNFNKINLGDVKTEGDNGRNNQELQEPEKLIEKDRYYQLNQELNKTEALLNKINLQEERAGRQEKIKLLDQEIQLLQRKQNNIHAIAEEERKERSELVKSLKTQGMKFSGTGDDITAANGQSILDKKLDAVNAHRNDKDRSTYNKLKSQYDDLKKSYDRFIELQITDIPKAGDQWTELATDIEKVKVDKISLSFEIFNDTLEPANRKLKELEHIYNLLGENDVAEKEKNINAQMKIKADMLNSINGKILEYQKLINSTKSTAEKEIYQKQIDSLKDQGYQLSEAITESVQKANDDKLDLYKDTIDKIKDLLKKQYDLEKDKLDESLDNYKEYINGIIEERDRLNDSEDYQESINESNTKINEIQAEIDKRKLAASQGDLVAINEIIDLQKQKAEEEKNLKDKQKDWERKQTKQNLQDNLKYYEDYTNDQKKLLDEKTSDTALQLQAEQLLAQNSITAVQDTINQLFNKTGENATRAGQLVQSELIAKLQQVMDIQKNLDSITALSSQSYSPNTNSNSSLSYVDRVKSQMRQNSDAYGSSSSEQKKVLSDKNLELGTSIGWYRDTHGVWYDQNGNLAQYATGTDDVKEISMVGEHGRELRVLNPNGKDSIIPNGLTEKLVSFANSPISFMQNLMPSIGLPQINPIASGAGSISIGDININGVTSVDRNSLPDLQRNIVREIKLQLNRGGTFRK